MGEYFIPLINNMKDLLFLDKGYLKDKLNNYNKSPIIMKLNENWIINNVHQSIELKPLKHTVEFIKKEEKFTRVFELILKHQQSSSSIKPSSILIFSENRFDIDELRDYL